MTDYGSKNVGEFGGNSVGENFHCLPDYHFSKCSSRTMAQSKEDTWRCASTDGQYHCSLTGTINPLNFYDLCNFCGDNYKTCQRYTNLRGKND
jgi:hypothetical protein